MCEGATVREPMRQDTVSLPSRPVGAAGLLSLATLFPLGLADAASRQEIAHHSLQPPWVVDLTPDGMPHEAVFGTGQDVDYYRLTVTELSEAAIYATSELDTAGTLFDSMGDEIASEEYGGEGRNFRIVALLRAGDYYLRIRQNSTAYDEVGAGKYTLYAETEPLLPDRLPLDGSSKEGVIDPAEHAEYFRIEVAELTQALIYSSGGLDTVGAVLDSLGREIVSDDDSGDGQNFHVSPLLWPGEYFLRVSPWTSSSGHRETGSYNLHAEGSPASVARLPLDGSSKEGVIEPGEQADYFRIDVTELTTAVLYTSGPSHTIGTLLDAEGREIMSAGDSWGNFRMAAVLRPGEYYVRVAQWQFGRGPVAPAEAARQPEDGSYILHAEGAPLIPTALELNGAPREGSIDSAEDSDYFRIIVTELTEVAIHSSGGLDTVGALLDSDGREIVSDDDGGSGGNFHIATLLWPDEYFVRVTPWVKFSGQFDVGSYGLHVEGAPATPTQLSLNGPPQGGVIETADDEDYYRFALTEPTAVVLYTTGNLDTAGVLMGTNGEEVAFNDDGGDQFINFRIVVILMRPAEYLLRVFSSSGAAGSYTMHAQGVAEDSVGQP